MSEQIISAAGLSKQYRLGAGSGHDMLRELVVWAVKAPFRRLRGRSSRAKHQTIWALKDVSFEVKRGEILGIIGRNGAGKSTLLKILSRITEPTEGCAELRGRVGSLLEVGTGFHGELTGLENIYLSGSILGMRRAEIKRKLDDIISFAEVEPFIDTPVKRYSSGMYLRLAFAVAAHMDPEILLVDEVLAVGDAAFQKKCLGKMGDVAGGGRTVLFVSHNMAAVHQLTQKCILLDSGRIVRLGPTAGVIDHYLNTLIRSSSTVYDLERAPRHPKDTCTGQIRFVTAELEEYPTAMVPAGADVNVQLTVRASETVNGFRFTLTIYRADGTVLGNLFDPPTHSIRKGETGTYRLTLRDLRLAPGRYYCVACVDNGDHLVQFDVVHDVLYFDVLAQKEADGIPEEWHPWWGSIRFKQPEVVRIA
jgi:lipopolysaccharide transport system ATP-binding protein